MLAGFGATISVEGLIQPGEASNTCPGQHISLSLCSRLQVACFLAPGPPRTFLIIAGGQL
jgi:hypothetical protein